MKRLLLIAAAAMGVTALSAVAGEGWGTDYKAAVEQAKEEGKYLLLDFSGSDWCGWCIKLDKEVFKQDAFKTYAADSLVTVLLDFPRKKEQDAAIKKQNAELMKKYGIRGFPTVLVLSPGEELVAKTGYRAGGPETYVAHLKEIITAHEAKQKDAAPVAAE